MRSRAILLSTASYLAVTSVAYAADIPVLKAPPPPVVASWTGFYIGIHGGVAGFNAKETATAPFLTTPQICSGTAPCRLSDTSGVLGGQAGYNWQIQNWVIGVEGDGSWINAKATATIPFVDGVDSANAKLSWLASARGRVGFVVADGAGLIYGTAGAAWGGVKEGWVENGYGRFGQLNKTLTGVVAGGGVEAMVSRNWTFRAEALWYGFEKQTINNIFAGTYTTRFTNSVLVGRLGLNFKW
jgi:outer membrane immunogenic protein